GHLSGRLPPSAWIRAADRGSPAAAADLDRRGRHGRRIRADEPGPRPGGRWRARAAIAANTPGAPDAPRRDGRADQRVLPRPASDQPGPRAAPRRRLPPDAGGPWTREHTPTRGAAGGGPRHAPGRGRGPPRA